MTPYPLTLAHPHHALRAKTCCETEQLRYFFYCLKHAPELSAWIRLNDQPFQIEPHTKLSFDDLSRTAKTITDSPLNSTEIMSQSFSVAPNVITAEQINELSRLISNRFHVILDDSQKALLDDWARLTIALTEHFEQWFEHPITQLIFGKIAADKNYSLPKKVAELESIPASDSHHWLKKHIQMYIYPEIVDNEATPSILNKLLLSAGISITTISIDSERYRLPKLYIDNAPNPIGFTLYNFDSLYYDDLVNSSENSDHASRLYNFAAERQEKFNNSIRDALYLAAASGDVEHMTRLIQDNTTFDLLAEDQGRWLLHRVIHGYDQIETFNGHPSAPKALIALLQDNGLLKTNEPGTEGLIENYLRTFKRPSSLLFNLSSTKLAHVNQNTVR